MTDSKHFPIVNGRGKMSPQDAVGPGNWPGDFGVSRQSKHYRTNLTRVRKLNGKRRHRSGIADKRNFD